MKKHHATLLVVAGIIAIVLATTLTVDSVEKKPEGYVVSDAPDNEAIACCTIGDKTCYALEDTCESCDLVCG